MWKKEEENIEKCRDSAFEIGRIWKKKAKTIPTVIGALGTLSKNQLIYLAELECSLSFETILNTVLLGTARILRRT